MSDIIFLYRLKDSDDRDCCAYISDPPSKFECGHYFRTPHCFGAAYSGSEFAPYEEIETIFTKEEYETFVNLAHEIHSLGYNIKSEDDPRMKRGNELVQQIEKAISKLKSESGIAFRNKIMESEKEWMKQEYDLSDAQVEDVISHYPYEEYKDRGIVSNVFEDIDEYAHEEAFALGWVDEEREPERARYFDYELFGQDLLLEDNINELNDGRIVLYNY